MTIRVEIDPETEAQLASRARAQGVPVERAAARILEDAVASRVGTPLNLNVDDFHTMLANMAEGSEQLPSLPTERFTRDSFYEDRV